MPLRRWLPHAVLAAGLAAGLLAVPARADDPAPSVDAVAEACAATGADAAAGGRACRSIEQLGRTGGNLCRWGSGDGDACALANGEAISPAEVDAYQGSWANRAHALQRALGDDLPLRLATFLATHNSYNSGAYAPSLSGLDANQVHTLYDQLRLDMRALELDVHWFPHAPSGGPAPVLCHGTGPHLGCSTDRHLREGLDEIAAWLDANPGEILILDLEVSLDDQAAFDATAGVVHEVLGDRLYLPERGETRCVPMPMEVTRRQIRDTGRQVLVTSTCGDGVSDAWAALVHSYGNRRQGTSGRFTPYPECGTDFSADDYERRWTRYWEDSTWLSAMAGTAGPPIDAGRAREMTRCGLNQPSLDQLVPDDGRLEALVWSWAPGEPAAGPACAAHTAGHRFAARGCADRLPFACLDPATGRWSVSRVAGSWERGDRACAAGRSSATFAVPTTGRQNERLREAKEAAGVTEVWLRYPDPSGDGAWTS